MYDNKIAFGLKYRSVLCHRVVQVEIATNYVKLYSQQDHQHAGAVNSHDTAGKTWRVKICILKCNIIQTLIWTFIKEIL